MVNLTLAFLVALYLTLTGVDISRISRHIKNAVNEGEIDIQRNLRKTQIANF